MGDTEGALAGVRILDLTDERGIYGAKLLADLGGGAGPPGNRLADSQCNKPGRNLCADVGDGWGRIML